GYREYQNSATGNIKTGARSPKVHPQIYNPGCKQAVLCLSGQLHHCLLQRVNSCSAWSLQR
ncbi:hypothetical protein HaLaN_00333, partial [Haematococcus lacustris]